MPQRAGSRGRGPGTPPIGSDPRSHSELLARSSVPPPFHLNPSHFAAAWGYNLPGGGVVPAPRAMGRAPSRGEQNDYSQHFVDTGLRPHNFIRDVDLADRFEEYPKLKELVTRKDCLIAERATPPMYMQCDLKTQALSPEVFGTRFDVILVDPPWEEYVRRAPGVEDSLEWWTFEEILGLRIEDIVRLLQIRPRSFFCGLETRIKWGFRRCEDICWVKTNKENPSPALRHDSNTLFQHTKEHCIEGTVRRSTDDI